MAKTFKGPDPKKKGKVVKFEDGSSYNKSTGKVKRSFSPKPSRHK